MLLGEGEGTEKVVVMDRALGQRSKRDRARDLLGGVCQKCLSFFTQVAIFGCFSCSPSSHSDVFMEQSHFSFSLIKLLVFVAIKES